MSISVTDDIFYVGVNDHQLDLFEGQYVVPNGMAYNSYVIVDEKIAVMDTVDANFGDEWMGKLTEVLDGRTPDYLVVQHMEPDHSSNIVRLMEAFPTTTVVASAKAFDMMEQFYGSRYAERQIVIKEGSTLELGKHTLSFVAAPMVHWPEVMMTYDAVSKTLFSADAFGKFGALDVEQEWDCEARRYYFGIVGKYGRQVQAVLKKAGKLDIARICSLHGPILSENLGHYLDLYNTWSSYGVESEGICICYTSVYGNTRKAVEELAAKLEAAGCPKVVVNDLAREDMAEAMEDAFRYGTLVLASTTYNMGVFPFMSSFIEHLVEHGYTKRKIGIMENGSWAPTAAKVMRGKLDAAKGLEFCENVVTIKSALNDESRAQMDALVAELMA
ncbi:MAG: MBL fold metallo-hydrolase [Coriobacteriales bacterium]|nr:MBL fold metallo-hydrolase [Coriobacteriales bacterium]